MQNDDSELLGLLRVELEAAAFVRFDRDGEIRDRSEHLFALLGAAAPTSADMATLWTYIRTRITPDPGDLAGFLGASRDRNVTGFTEAGRGVRLTVKSLQGGESVLLLQQVTPDRSRDRLEQINDVLEQTLNQLPVALAVVGKDRHVIHASDAALAIVGRRREEVVGHTTRILYPDNATFEAAGKQLYPARRQRMRTKAQHANGTLVDVEVTMLPLPDAGVGAPAFVALVEDVTQQRTLAAELDRFHDIVEASSDALVFIDRDHCYRAVNQAYLSMWGKQREDVLGRHVREIVGAVMYEEKIRARLEACLLGEEEVLSFADCVSSMPIAPQYVEATYSAHRTADGIIDGVVVNIRNTTERVVAEQARRREASHHLELLKKQAILLDNLPTLVFIKDLENNILQVTQRVAELTGLARDRIEGRPSAEIYPGMADQYYADDRMVIESGKPKRGIVEPLRGADGKEIWLLTDKIPYRDERGEVAGIIVCASDITDLRQSQLALEESEKRYRMLIELIPQGVVVHNALGEITAANPAACRILGLSVDEILGKTSHATAWQVIREDGRAFPADEHPAMMALRRGAPALGVVMGVFNPKRNAFSWIQVDAVPIQEGDAMSSVFASFSDITESRELQQAVIQAQKLEAIGRLAGGIAHDFNNILGSMLGFTELAQLHTRKDDTTVQAHLEQVVSAGMRASKLVQQLLIYARGDRTQAKDPTPLAPLLTESIALLRPLLPARISIDFEVPSEQLLTVIDPVHMQQMIINLGINAGDAMAAGGHVKISAGPVGVKDVLCRLTQERVSGRWLEIAVADEGCGMAEEVINDIFQPFFTTKAIGRGSGMGLSVLSGLVLGYGGHVLVSSDLGRGTLFRLLFPPVE